MSAFLKIKGLSSGNNTEFESNAEYEVIALKIVSWLYNKKKISKHHYNMIINSDEYMSYIIYAAMYADWTCDPTRSNKKTFRNKCIVWQIYDIIKFSTKEAGRLTKKISEIETDDNNLDEVLFIDEYDIYSNKETEYDQFNDLIKIAQEILSEEWLSIFMLHYHSGWKIAKIARKYNKHYATIKKILDKSTDKIRKHVSQLSVA